MNTNTQKLPLILFIDLFCGAGGVSTGADRARILGKYRPVKLIACVNHDPLAIESHKTNHKQAIHFNEDIRSEEVVAQTAKITRYWKEKYPEAIVLLWASMKCTNYSKAKGGMPRDADSRSLPEYMHNYIEAIDPDFFYFENVEEFMAWGPLDENGRPVSMKKGADYIKWTNKIKRNGYSYDANVLNSADFGAHTKRRRLFGIFSKGDNPIVWPSPTHAEHPQNDGLFDQLKPWNAVRECLDFQDEGQSIFTRKKPLVEATLKRILAGLNKYVAKGDGVFIQKHFSGRPWGKVYDVNQPAHSITTTANQSVVKVKGAFSTKYYGNGDNVESINKPSGTIRTKDGFMLAQCSFLDMQYSNGGQHSSIDAPANTITSVPKHNLVSAKSNHFIMNPQYNSKGGSIDSPCFTLIASMDKSAPSLVSASHGEVPEIDIEDSPMMVKIKEFCQEYGITDITTRMLRVPELKKIQGFGEDYYLAGNQADQKKFIGNSVPPAVVQAMMEALTNKLYMNEIIAEVA
jgi:DNA (cytosine-5)-methyltransferase 1